MDNFNCNKISDHEKSPFISLGITTLEGGGSTPGALGVYFSDSWKLVCFRGTAQWPFCMLLRQLKRCPYSLSPQQHMKQEQAMAIFDPVPCPILMEKSRLRKGSQESPPWRRRISSPTCVGRNLPHLHVVSSSRLIFPPRCCPLRFLFLKTEIMMAQAS